MNYYEGSISNKNYIYPTDEEIHLIIHEAHEQAIAFAKILEFGGYENLFYGGTFNACESDLMEEKSNQTDEKSKETDKVDFELNEISEAADSINIYDNFNSEEDNKLILKQCQMEVNAIYTTYKQLAKKITQGQHDETFQTGVLLSENLDILFLISVIS
jgi:hypothetical protein